MKALLDTAIFLWWITDHSQFSHAARQYLRDPQSQPLISAASIWEMIVKHKLGMLHFPEPIDKFLLGQITKNAFSILPIEGRHTLELARLPDHHADPFDRLLIAQSRVENIPLVTADPAFKTYEVAILW